MIYYYLFIFILFIYLFIFSTNLIFFQVFFGRTPTPGCTPLLPWSGEVVTLDSHLAAGAASARWFWGSGQETFPGFRILKV